MITVPEPRVHRLAPVLVLAVGTFAMGTDSFVLAGILPQLASGLRVSEASAGQVVTAFALTYAVTAPFLAAATGKVRRKTLLTFGLSLFIAANLASIAATGLPFLLLARIAAALGAALFTPTASAAAVALAGADRRGLALSIILGGLAVGTVFGVPAGTALGQHFGWQASLLFIAAVALVALAALLVTLPTLPLPPVVRLHDRLALLVDRRVLGIVAVTTLASAAGIIVYTYLARILLDTVGISGSALTAALLAWGIGGSTGAFGSGWLTDRHGPRRTLVLAIGILALSLLGLGFVPTAGLTPPLMAVTGAAAWSVATPNNHRLTGLAPESPSVVISANSSGIYLGQALGAAAGGLVLTAGGGAEVLCVAGATVAAAAFALNAILADH